MRSTQLIFFLFLNLFTTQIQSRLLQNTTKEQSSVPLEYIIISCVAIALLIIAILVYRELQKEEKKIQFTVFNSQYLGKQSTRSNSEHDFPNFDIEIMKQRHEEQDNGGDKSAERRRRRRKVDRLEKNEPKAGELDLTPPVMINQSK